MTKPPPPPPRSGAGTGASTPAGGDASERAPRAERVAAILPVHFRNAGQFLVSYCLNLSRGGLFVTTHDPAPVGARLTLRLTVPELAQPLELVATVRWVRRDATEDGPAGMGLRFEDVDDAIGDRIDVLVQRAMPLRIDLVGRPDRAGQHLDALVRTLVTCSTNHHALERGVEARVRGADLVILDVDADPGIAEGVLASMASHSDGPPVIALCSARLVDRRERIATWARVVATPVDKEELQTVVLDSLGQAHVGGRVVR